MVKDHNNFEEDAEIKFIHPCSPTSSIYWPNHDDIWNILFSNILCKIDVPQQSARSGQNQKLLPATLKKIRAKHYEVTKSQNAIYVTILQILFPKIFTERSINKYKSK